MFTIDANGNVGIGPTTIDAALHIERDDATVDTEIRISNGGGRDSRIVFEEGGQGVNFAIRYDGALNQLEFDTFETNDAFTFGRFTGSMGIGDTTDTIDTGDANIPNGSLVIGNG